MNFKCYLLGNYYFLIIATYVFMYIFLFLEFIPGKRQINTIVTEFDNFDKIDTSSTTHFVEFQNAARFILNFYLNNIALKKLNKIKFL